MEDLNDIDLDLAERCPNCQQPLYRSPSARPVPTWQPAAIALFVVGILAGLGVVAWKVVVRATSDSGQVQRTGLGFGIAFVICGVAYAMPRVRKFNCRGCGWAGKVYTGTLRSDAPPDSKLVARRQMPPPRRGADNNKGPDSPIE